jgi:predicted deacylase
MHRQEITLAPDTPGTEHRLTVLRFGSAGSGPKAYIQAALHADEVPALLVAQYLRTELQALEARGELLGEVVLVPWANPVGLGQQSLGQLQGRFDLRDGINFNRGYADLLPAVAEAVGPVLGASAETNQRLVRQVLRQAAQALTAQHATEDLKRQLLRLAVDADIVLDLHCDGEAALHLYALTPQSDMAAELGALLQAHAVLVATESGDSPFDEACSRPWLQLRQQFAAMPIPLACFAVTVELRGQADTSHALAAQDARALVEFLRRRGVLAGTPAPLPQALCEPTPLAGSEPLAAPHAGVVVFHADVGARVQQGQTVADVVDLVTGHATPVRAQSGGVLYARCAARWAAAGGRLGKIAGTTLARSGKLLSP